MLDFFIFSSSSHNHPTVVKFAQAIAFSELFQFFILFVIFANVVVMSLHGVVGGVYFPKNPSPLPPSQVGYTFLKTPRIHLRTMARDTSS